MSSAYESKEYIRESLSDINKKFFDTIVNKEGIKEDYEESLVNYLYRCAKTLQFDPEIANPDSIANRDALPFWNANKNNRKVIPCDKQVLPILDGPAQIIINQKATPKITIKAQTEKPKINIINR